MSACVWVYEVQAVVHCEMIVALVLEAIISFPHVAHHVSSRQYLSAYNEYQCIFINALYRYKEAGLGFTANATKDPLSFDVATAVILHLAKLGLINLNSSTTSTYRPLYDVALFFRHKPHGSSDTNLPPFLWTFVRRPGRFRALLVKW